MSWCADSSVMATVHVMATAHVIATVHVQAPDVSDGRMMSSCALREAQQEGHNCEAKADRPFN